MAENRGLFEIEQRRERELNNGARSRMGTDTAAEKYSGRTAAAAVMHETPVLLAICAYVGATCAAVWVSLNLLHWFWRQLQ